MPDTYAETWHYLQRTFEALDDSGDGPIVLSALPFRTDTHHDHSRLPFVLVPPGRLVATAIGMRGALPDRMIVLVGAAETVTLGTNHLIHAARRNMGMILLVLRSDLLPTDEAELDRSGWVESGLPTGLPSGTPLEWAEALNASLVARADVTDVESLADLLRLAHRRTGFSVVGLTRAPSLTLGVQSTNDWPEFFAAYRQWAAPLQNGNSAPPSHPDRTPAPDAPARVEVRIAGIGGHGVKLAGTILSEAAGLAAGMWATHYGEYGSATRGGPSKVDVVYGARRISYAGADHPDVLVALSQDSFDRNRHAVTDHTHLVVDSEVEDGLPANAIRVPIVALAREHTGKPIGAGVASLGAIALLAEGMSLETMREAVLDKLPGRIAQSNLDALEATHHETSQQIGVLR